MSGKNLKVLILAFSLMANIAMANEKEDILFSAGFAAPPAPPQLTEEMKAQMKKDGVATPEELGKILEKCKGKERSCVEAELKAEGFNAPVAPAGAPAPKKADHTMQKSGTASAL